MQLPTKWTWQDLCICNFTADVTQSNDAMHIDIYMESSALSVQNLILYLGIYYE
jgi:hypothetical protein